MNKIAIEITPEGWRTSITINGKEFEQKYVVTATGARCIDGDFENEDDIPDEIYNALNSSFPFECMQALK